jgi:hypothetical protein
MFSTSKVERAKNLYESFPTEFAGSTQNLKKNYRDRKSIN